MAFFCSEIIKDRSIQNVVNVDREIWWALANLWDTVGNLRVLLSASSAFVNLRVPKHLNDCNEHSRHFRGTFGNFRPLSLTTSACVNLHILNLPLLRTRAMVNAYSNAFTKLRSLKWTLSPSVGDTFGNFWPLSLTSSACVKSSCLLTISTNQRYRKWPYAFVKMNTLAIFRGYFR